MKKLTKYSYLLILFGLILALPLTPLRKTLSTTFDSYTEKAYLSLGVDSIKNKRIATVIGGVLQIDNVYIDVKDVGYSPKPGTPPVVARNMPFAKKIKSVKYISDRDEQSLEAAGVPEFDTEGSDARPKTKNRSQNSRNSFAANVLPYMSRKPASTNTKGANTLAQNKSTNTELPSGAPKQSAGGGPPPDNTGDNPIGSLPIGDGYFFLIILATIFGCLKIKRTFNS